MGSVVKKHNQVWIVIAESYEDFEIVAVCANHEKAKFVMDGLEDGKDGYPPWHKILIEDVHGKGVG